MSTTTYQVKKKVTGGYAVSYACPHCATALTSVLDEAGTSQACPTCGKPFVVHGKAEREQIRAKQELERRTKEEAAKQAAEAKRVAQVETARLNQLAKQEEAAYAREAHAKEQRQLLAIRRSAILKDRNNEKQSFTLQVVLLVLALDVLLSLLVAAIATVTVIGIPIAIALVVNAAITLGLHHALVMLNNLNRSTDEAVAHLRFQSSQLSDKMDTTRRE